MLDEAATTQPGSCAGVRVLLPDQKDPVTVSAVADLLCGGLVYVSTGASPLLIIRTCLVAVQRSCQAARTLQHLHTEPLHQLSTTAPGRGVQGQLRGSPAMYNQQQLQQWFRAVDTDGSGEIDVRACTCTTHVQPGTQDNSRQSAGQGAAEGACAG